MRVCLLAWCVLTVASCSPSFSSHFATPKEVEPLLLTTGEKGNYNTCYQPEAYVEHPELMNTRYIRVNFHFMGSSDGVYGLPKDTIVQYAKDWLYASNLNLGLNEQMYLPHGNHTPVLPIPYRYVLTPDPHIPGDQGVYYHVDDTLVLGIKTGIGRNITDKRVVDRYSIQRDSVLNIFVLNHPLDSITSKTYKADISGISLGSAIKMFGSWNLKPASWDARGVLNHEVGHSLGLAHTWSGDDGCDDTPMHPNCWNVSDTPPCDSLYSNNMMDYNLHWAALTPCQIGKILMNMSNPSSPQRKFLEPHWCTLDSTKTIVIRDSVRWSCNTDLFGNLIIADGGKLEITCRVSLPAGAQVTIEPGGTLEMFPKARLHNACGGEWQGILLEKIKKRQGKIRVAEGARIENAIYPLPIEKSPTR